MVSPMELCSGIVAFQRCYPSGHHNVATSISIMAPRDALHQPTMIWPPPPMLQLQEMFSIRGPRCGHHHQHHGSQRCSPSAHHDVATTTGVAAPGDALHHPTMPWPPPVLGDRESFSPAGPDIGFAMLLTDTLAAGAEAKLLPPALHGSTQDWLSCSAQHPLSPPWGLCGCHRPPEATPRPGASCEGQGMDHE